MDDFNLDNLLKDVSSLFGDSDTTASSSSNSSNSLDDIDDVLNNLAIDYSKTVYVICEKKNFRTNSLYDMLIKEYNHVQILCSSTDGITHFDEPLCFCIDVSNNIPRRILQHIRDEIIKSKVPVFLFFE